MFSVGFEFGLCGFGLDRGYISELRVGAFSVWWRNSSLLSVISGMRRSLSDATMEFQMNPLAVADFRGLNRLEVEELHLAALATAAGNPTEAARAKKAAARYRQAGMDMIR